MQGGRKVLRDTGHKWKVRYHPDSDAEDEEQYKTLGTKKHPPQTMVIAGVAKPVLRQGWTSEADKWLRTGRFFWNEPGDTCLPPTTRSCTIRTATCSVVPAAPAAAWGRSCTSTSQVTGFTWTSLTVDVARSVLAAGGKKLKKEPHAGHANTLRQRLQRPRRVS